MIFLIPILLILNCCFIFFFKRWFGPIGIFLISIIVLFISIIILFISLVSMLNFGYYIYFDFGRWFFVLDIIDSNLIFIFDNLSCLMSILVLFLSLFAQYFGAEYMYREAFISRLLYLLNMFITSVIFLFLVFDFFLILIVWELIGLFSLLLVNYYSIRVYTLKAALKTFLFSRLSDLFIFFSFILFIIFFYSTDFSIIFFKIPFFMFLNIYIFNYGFNLLNFLAILIILSSAIKAAQFWVHTWLPDAMEAPTPASALIHSSTLVIMGIYFIIRFNILFEFSSISNFLLAFIGSLTIAFGSITASFQNDIKKLVAYSTISQMGYLFCGCGFLCYNEVIFYLSIHALNKAFLFIIVGYIVHFFNSNTDLRFMGSTYLYALDITFILIIVSLNLTGLPYTSGFLAKEFLLFQTFKDEIFSYIIRACWFISFFFTPFYMLFLNIIVFFYSKISLINLYTSIKLISLSKFYTNKINFVQYDYSLIFSKLTGLVLLIFFFFINFIGEFFISIGLNILTLNLFMNEISITNITINLLNNSNIFSSTLSWFFQYIIYLSLLFSMKFLINLFK